MTVSLPPLHAETLEQALSRHRLRYPGMQDEDVYKLIYQGYLGPAHFAVDPESLYDYLLREADNLGKGWEGDTLLVEPLPGGFVRVNIRPFLRRGGKVRWLADGMFRSLSVPRDSAGFIAAYRELFGEENGIVPGVLTPGGDQASGEMQPSFPPPIHHSALYRKLYNPHYRVVSREEGKRLLELLAVKSAVATSLEKAAPEKSP